jgi:hypothetical protein
MVFVLPSGLQVRVQLELCVRTVGDSGRVRRAARTCRSAQRLIRRGVLSLRRKRMLEKDLLFFTRNARMPSLQPNETLCC